MWRGRYTGGELEGTPKLSRECAAPCSLPGGGPSPTSANCPQCQGLNPPGSFGTCLPSPGGEPGPPSPGTPRPGFFAPSKPEPKSLLPNKQSADHWEPTHPLGHCQGLQVLWLPSPRSTILPRGTPGPGRRDARGFKGRARGNSTQRRAGRVHPAQQVPGCLAPVPGRAWQGCLMWEFLLLSLTCP